MKQSIFNASNNKCTLSSGFTLVEMAIVLVIFGTLMAMFLSPLSAQRSLQNRAETQRLLLEAKEALYGYSIVNGHLPCPDTDPVPDGTENRTGGTCDSDSGILPWNSLGIDRVDAWAHYFSYRVDATFSDSSNLFNISDAESSSGIVINELNGLPLTSTNSRPAAVIFSHGENGFGATNTNQIAGSNNEPAPTDIDELENTDGDVTFVSHPPTVTGFDDQLTWISPKVLITRMLMAERLP